MGDVGALESWPRDECTPGEAAVRRQVSREVWRALAEPGFACALLADPLRAIGPRGCTLQQQRRLASISAVNVQDFARQAELLFWPAPPITRADARTLSGRVSSAR